MFSRGGQTQAMPARRLIRCQFCMSGKSEFRSVHRFPNLRRYFCWHGHNPKWNHNAPLHIAFDSEYFFSSVERTFCSTAYLRFYPQIAFKLACLVDKGRAKE